MHSDDDTTARQQCDPTALRAIFQARVVNSKLAAAATADCGNDDAALPMADAAAATVRVLW